MSLQWRCFFNKYNKDRPLADLFRAFFLFFSNGEVFSYRNFFYEGRPFWGVSNEKLLNPILRFQFIGKRIKDGGSLHFHSE